VRAWPDAAAVEARLQKVWRRSALQSVLRGVAAGLIAGAVLIAIGVRSPVIASPASAVAVPAIIGAVLAFARARRHRHRVALTVEARVAACQNVVLTSTEIARGDRELRDDVSARVHADALKAMTALTPATLVPIGRDVAAVAVALMLVAGATLLKARAEAPGLRVVDPASAEVRRLTVTVTPPAYAGLPAEVLADPERRRRVRPAAARRSCPAGRGSTGDRLVVAEPLLSSRRSSLGVPTSWMTVRRSSFFDDLVEELFASFDDRWLAHHAAGKYRRRSFDRH